MRNFQLLVSTSTLTSIIALPVGTFPYPLLFSICSHYPIPFLIDPLLDLITRSEAAAPGGAALIAGPRSEQRSSHLSSSDLKMWLREDPISIVGWTGIVGSS